MTPYATCLYCDWSPADATLRGKPIDVTDPVAVDRAAERHTNATGHTTISGQRPAGRAQEMRDR
jgi:hypothetical protein